VGFYEQDPEVDLLAALSKRLKARVVLDVGAERGALAEAMLTAGAEELHAIEPHPDNASALRRRFADDPRVTVHECAASDADGDAVLHVSSDSRDEVISFGHTLLTPADTEAIGGPRRLMSRAGRSRR
jgi:predicted RNA methylase